MTPVFVASWRASWPNVDMSKLSTLDQVNAELEAAFGAANEDTTPWIDIDYEEPEVEHVDIDPRPEGIEPARRGDWHMFDSFLRCVA